MFGPDRDLSKTLTVNSAKAIDNGVLPTFFLIPSYEKNILTRISPMSSSVSWTTLKSTDLLSASLILAFRVLL